MVAAFRLALLLGKTLSELDMTWEEFVYWNAYLSIEPPDKGDNQRTAMLLSQITNMSGRSLPDRKRVKPEDFLGGPQEQQSLQAQIDFMKSLGKKDG